MLEHYNLRQHINKHCCLLYDITDDIIDDIILIYINFQHRISNGYDNMTVKNMKNMTKQFFINDGFIVVDISDDVSYMKLNIDTIY